MASPCKWVIKRFFIILVLPAVASAAWSQAYHLDADNEPLNRVLNRLGLEISFDDRALSAYSVTISQSFDNPEKALTRLLEDKPFRIEKIGTVYVIVPSDNPPPQDIHTALAEAGIERFVFKGTVMSQTDSEPLEYAIVSFLDKNNRLLITGITNAKGYFSIQTPHIPAQIKISYLGYETLLRDIDNLNRELGIFPLRESTVALDETVVTAKNIRPDINHSIYTVTPQMRNGVDNALEMLNKIPGAAFDKSSKSVRLNQYANILLLVDGIQSSQDYLNHLAPDRIHAVEVVYALSGRFVSDDYAGIIHFMLKKDYTGYDIHVSSATSFNLSPKADTRRVEKFPAVGIVYTTRKLNFFGTYSYEWEDRDLFSSKSLIYNNVSELVSLPSTHPENLSQNENHTVTGGLNYHINPLQLIGIQADYSRGKVNTFQRYTLNRTDIPDNTHRILTHSTENRLNAEMFTGTLFYQGQVSNRLRLYGDFSYNYYYNDMANEFIQEETATYRYADFWNEYKHQTSINLEAKYLLTEKVSLEAGYANTLRSYASGTSQGIGFLDYSENRNKAYFYLSHSFTDKIGLRSGASFEYIIQRNREAKRNSFRALPFLWVNYRISRHANLTAGYATNQAYPLLYQLSPMTIVIDTFLTRIGNPDLQFAYRHHVFAELSLWNKLRVTPQLVIIHNDISEMYDLKEYKLYRTFENVRHREYSLNVSYNQSLGKYLHLKTNVIFYHDEAVYQGVRNALNGWTFQAEADWYHPEKSVGVQLGYYRNMKKNVLWQGYQMSDKDYWCVSLRKEWWQNRISATLSYIPPIALGVRYDRVNEIDMPFYREQSVVSLESFNQMLMLNLSIRFGSGSAKPTESRTDRSSDEREK